MTDNLNAEIIAIGTEILLGEITDTNSVFIARALRDIGVNIYYMTSVGDNQQRIANAINIALDRAEVIITCGGLGPTVDDMTRQGIAIATDRPLEFKQDLLDQIAARFQMFRATMTENNKRQAYLPAGAIAIENPVGTAPGFMVETERGVVISLPGVPREMKFLMQERVVPYLLQKYKLGVIKARILKTAGIGESSLDDMLGDELLEASNPTIGLAAHHGVIDVRMTAKADDLTQAESMLDATEIQVMDRIGYYVFGKDDDQLEDVVTQFLHDQGWTIAIVEAGIQDAVAAKLKTADDSTGIIQHQLYYPHPDDLYQTVANSEGWTLRDLATQVAQNICEQHNTQAAIAIVSYPDIDESADIEQATAAVIYTPQNTASRVYGFGGRSDMTRGWVSRWAMSTLWRMLKDQQQHVE